MNLITREIFGTRKNNQPNTFLGGVSSTISTPALLATKLGISVGAISNFTIVGSDIKCHITGSYTIPNECLKNDGSFIYYTDNDGLVTSLGTDVFFGCTNTIGTIELKNCLTGGTSCFFNTRFSSILLGNITSISNDFFNSSTSKLYYIPRCTNLGSSALNNNVFALIPINSGAIIYADPSLATNNGGAPDGDLAYAITRGATVRYVTNFTAPNAITTLAAGTIYNTAVQLNFTPPSSINTIDYYDLYINGVLQSKRITASGQFITGLTASTSYTITLVAVDVFYNKSVVSNSLSVSTNTTSAVPTTGLISYYKLDGNSNDSFGSNNGTDTSVSYVSGKIGNAGSYNGSTSYTSVADNDNLSFTNGTNDLPFSVSFWVKMNATGLSFFVSKSSNGFANNLGEWNIYYNAGKITVVFSNKTSGYLGNEFSNVMNIGIWYNISMTYNGNGFNSGIKLYVDAVSKYYNNLNSGTYTSMGNTSSLMIFGQDKAGGGLYKLNGLLEEISIYNKELTKTEIDLIYNSGNGITL